MQLWKGSSKRESVSVAKLNKFKLPTFLSNFQRTHSLTENVIKVKSTMSFCILENMLMKPLELLGLRPWIGSLLLTTLKYVYHRSAHVPNGCKDLLILI